MEPIARLEVLQSTVTNGGVRKRGRPAGTRSVNAAGSDNNTGRTASPGSSDNSGNSERITNGSTSGSRSDHGIDSNVRPSNSIGILDSSGMRGSGTGTTGSGSIPITVGGTAGSANARTHDGGNATGSTDNTGRRRETQSQTSAIPVISHNGPTIIDATDTANNRDSIPILDVSHETLGATGISSTRKPRTPRQKAGLPTEVVLEGMLNVGFSIMVAIRGPHWNVITPSTNFDPITASMVRLLDKLPVSARKNFDHYADIATIFMGIAAIAAPAIAVEQQIIAQNKNNGKIRKPVHQNTNPATSAPIQPIGEPSTASERAAGIFTQPESNDHSTFPNGFSPPF